jgi:hypothetical protein
MIYGAVGTRTTVTLIGDGDGAFVLLLAVPIVAGAETNGIGRLFFFMEGPVVLLLIKNKIITFPHIEKN